MRSADPSVAEIEAAIRRGIDRARKSHRDIAPADFVLLSVETAAQYGMYFGLAMSFEETLSIAQTLSVAVSAGVQYARAAAEDAVEPPTEP